MWCDRCQQDIPTIKQTSGELTCLRCGSIYGQNKGQQSDSVETAPQPSGLLANVEPLRLDTDGSAEHHPHYDAWEIEQELLQLKRFLAEEYLTGRQVTRFELPHLAMRPSHFQRRTGRKRLETSSSAQGIDRGVAWYMFLCGVATFGCGAILLGWGFNSSQEHLFTWGVPISVAGLVFFIVAIFLAVFEPDSPSMPEKPMVRNAVEHLETAQPKSDLL